MTAYGTSVGYVPLRAWIAERHGVEPEQVLVTNGSMQADAFLFDALVAPATRSSSSGPRTTARCCRCATAAPTSTWSSSSPTGSTPPRSSGAARRRPAEARAHHPQLPEPRRLHALGRQARCGCSSSPRDTSFTIFEDDPYVALRFEGESLPTMISTAPDVVVYASSFSKTVCPGIRVGYLVGPEELIARIAKSATSTYISPNMVAQAIVNQFCRSGAIERSIETVREALRERAQTLCGALAEQLPDARFVAPEGGYFLWVDLPRRKRRRALFDAAAARGVQFVKGSDFVLDGGECSLRLAYSGVTPEQIEEGVQRLAEAYAEAGAPAHAA